MIDGADSIRAVDMVAALQTAAQQVKAPTLLVRGLSSDVVSDEGVREFRCAVPHLEVVEVAGAGHMVSGDRNDAFNAGVLDFLERHRPVAGRSPIRSLEAFP